MNARRQSLPLLVGALFLAALTLAVPGNTRAMEACRESACTFYGGGIENPNAHCGPFDTHCHCFVNANPELNQHQSACNVIEEP